MPSTTLVPITDQTTTGWTTVGGATFSASLDEGIASADDTTSYVHISSGTSALQLTVTERPATFTSAISCDWAARCASVSDAQTHTLELQIFESDGATAITDKTTQLLSASAYTDYSGSFSITGTNNASSWSGARIHISLASGYFTQFNLTAIELNVTYNSSASIPIPIIVHHRKLQG